MQHKTKRKGIESRELIVLTIMVLTLLIVVGIVTGSITNPRINSGDVLTNDDLICYFTINSPPGLSDVNITWYNGASQNLSTTISCTSGVECNSSGSGTVPKEYTTKGETWMCKIEYYNGTAEYETINTSKLIGDTAPYEPRIFWINESEIVDSITILPEDTISQLIVNTTDDDGDAIVYSINDTTFCDIDTISATTGNLTCNPTLETHLGTRSIKVYAEAGSYRVERVWNINVTQTNDAPQFSPAITNQTLIEDQVFNYIITGIDDENNTPLNLFVINITPFINITVSVINNNTFVLTLENNRTASYAEAKLNYTVTILLNDTDNITGNSKNTTVNFTLSGITYNHVPNISYFVYDNTSITQGGNLSIYFNATDIDNQSIRFSSNSTIDYTITYNSSTIFNYDGSNSSFKYGWINITNLSNEYVITHDFTIFAYDTTDENSNVTISMFIINTNDAPTIDENSNNAINSYNNTNLTNLIAYTGVLFNYQVNASDIDELTYDYANTGINNYSTNDSRFSINIITGLLNFIPTEVGNFSFIVTVTDKEGLTYNHTANIEILLNANPIFTQDPINITCYEFDATNWNNNCYYNISANVTDPDSGNGDYVVTYWTNSSLFQINSTTGIINFTADQSMIGTYEIQLNITDTKGGTNSTIIYLTIDNTNNAPNITAYVPSINRVVDKTYQITYTATDLDLNLENTYENLTFTQTITGPNTSVFSLEKISASQAQLIITPINASYDGTYSINITVTDYYGNYSYYFTTFEIFNATAPPTIESIIPSGTPLNSTINNITWVNTTNFPGLITNISISENSTYTFNQTSYADNSSYTNSLNYSWYYDGVFNTSTRYYTKEFDFFSNGTHNITFVAQDQYESNNSFTWIINVTNVNRPPTYNSLSLENLTVSGSGFISDYLTYSDSRKRFYDPDDDPSDIGYSTDNSTTLVFSSTMCPYANFTFEQNRLNIAAFDIGVCYIIFTATDPVDSSLYVSSEIITINITNVSQTATEEIIVPVPTQTTGGGTTTEPVPIPLPEEVEKPKPLQLMTPKLVTTYKNATIKIPIVVNNTWNDRLVGITLEAKTSASNVTLYLDKIFIPQLEVGESFEATLYVKNYKSEGHYEIQVYANVSVPEYKDVATIFINSAEMRSEGEELENKISFASDLLSSNPECQELNELLSQAKKELGNNNYLGTAKIIDNVINGCKYLVNNAKKNTELPDRNFIKTLEWKKSYNDYLIIVIFGLLFIASLYYILKKDNPEQEF